MAALAEGGQMSIETLGKLLRVSKMTVHRDLDALAAERRVRKVRGGVALPEELEPSGEGRCTFCHGQIAPDSRTKVTLYRADGTHQHACCPHCGLLAVPGLGDQVTTVLVTDFLFGRIINARSATYLVGPALSICCAPTTLAFHQVEDARRFQRGFGGQLLDFDAALRRLRDEMMLEPPMG